MPFTHYPKQEANVIFAWVWPRPPDKDNFLTHPRFSSTNRMNEPLGPGKYDDQKVWNGPTLSACHSAQNFTRFLGSIACDQKLEVTFSFSNDEVDAEGNWVTDEQMPSLHYDAEALKQLYDPAKQGATGKYMVTIYGRWIKVDVRNIGDKPTEWMRCYVRGSVF